MKRAFAAVVSAALLVAAPAAPAADVLVLASGNGDIDESVLKVLEFYGHKVKLGPKAQDFQKEPLSLEPFDVVYLQLNANWELGDMPEKGQLVLVEWVKAGGGLVTGEWTHWRAAEGALQTLKPILPAHYVSRHDAPGTLFEQATPDPVLNFELPPKFDFPLSPFGNGTESKLEKKGDATLFYASSKGLHGVAGWKVGMGRVLSFSTTNGLDQLKHKAFQRLLANAMYWAAGETQGGCTADCDQSGDLGLFDFLCFVNLFNLGEAAADCDGNKTLDLFDFLCFTNNFNAGC